MGVSPESLQKWFPAGNERGISERPHLSVQTPIPSSIISPSTGSIPDHQSEPLDEINSLFPIPCLPSPSESLIETYFPLSTNLISPAVSDLRTPVNPSTPSSPSSSMTDPTDPTGPSTSSKSSPCKWYPTPPGGPYPSSLPYFHLFPILRNGSRPFLNISIYGEFFTENLLNWSDSLVSTEIFQFFRTRKELTETLEKNVWFVLEFWNNAEKVFGNLKQNSTVFSCKKHISMFKHILKKRNIHVAF